MHRCSMLIILYLEVLWLEVFQQEVMGETQLKNRCPDVVKCSESEKVNRRTEFVIQK